MKTKEEIEQLASKRFIIKQFIGEDDYNRSETIAARYGFEEGYTQCQEDIKGYIFEVAFQFHRLGKYSGNTSDTHFTDIYEETIKSIKK
jgi:hypothetical protein